MTILKEYKTIDRIEGPLVYVKGTHDVGLGEVVEIAYGGKRKSGQVLETGVDNVVIQLFEGTTEVSKNMSIKFLGEGITIKLNENVKGRILNGLGEPIDGGTPLIGKKYDILANALNPYSREMPNDFIQTGISTIDTMATLVRGQKLPIFSGAGLNHNDLALQIAKQAKVIGDENTDFLVVFAAMGITNEEALKFQKSFEDSGTIDNSILFINKADDPSVERLMTPKMALTTAEYFAFEKNYHVLVIMTDITNYCESLREIGAAREEVPGRRGYPGYMYTDLAQIYERAGRINSSSGSITQLPILTMPADDKTHPIVDLTGYITEGQIYLSRDLKNQGIYPEINVPSCLSRMMPIVAGSKTRKDHKKVSDQMYAIYGEGIDLRGLVAIVGEEALNDRDLRKLNFAKEFENKFVKQGLDENRSIEDSLTIAWNLLRIIPRVELTKIDEETKDKYY